MQGSLPDSAEEGSRLLFRTKGGRPLILNYLGKRKEKLQIGGKESFQSQCMRDYWSPLLSRLILPEAVLEHWKRGVEQ
jgi:hypothetical protein